MTTMTGVKPKNPQQQKKKNNKRSKKNKNNKDVKPVAVKAPSALGSRLTRSGSNRVFSQSRLNGKDGVRIHGHEFFKAVSSGSVALGANIVTFLLSPINIQNSRLQKFAQLYEKYVFRKFKIHYTSAQPTSTSGQYIIAFDKDVADATPPASSAGITEYFAMQNATIANVWDNASLDCSLTDTQDFFYTNYTGYDGRIVYQGQVYMAAVVAGTYIGSMWIEYDIDLWDPNVDTVTSVGVVAEAAPAVTHTTGGTNYDMFDDFPDNQQIVDSGSGEVTLGRFIASTDEHVGIVLNGADYMIAFRYDAIKASGSANLKPPAIRVLEWTQAVAASKLVSGAPDITTDSSIVWTLPTTNMAYNGSGGVVYSNFGVLHLPLSKACWFFMKSQTTDGTTVTWSVTSGSSVLQLSTNLGYNGLYDLYKARVDKIEEQSRLRFDFLNSLAVNEGEETNSGVQTGIDKIDLRKTTVSLPRIPSSRPVRSNLI